MRLFIANLPFTITEPELRRLFKRFGDIQVAQIITDESGNSRGLGIVEMSNDSALWAIKKLHNSQVKGRQITVRKAREEKGQ
jgi:RNA recognition motif-containing protein